jgi:hypothetical protein
MRRYELDYSDQNKDPFWALVTEVINFRAPS